MRCSRRSSHVFWFPVFTAAAVMPTGAMAQTQVPQILPVSLGTIVLIGIVAFLTLYIVLRALSMCRHVRSSMLIEQESGERKAEMYREMQTIPDHQAVIPPPKDALIEKLALDAYNSDICHIAMQRELEEFQALPDIDLSHGSDDENIEQLDHVLCDLHAIIYNLHVASQKLDAHSSIIDTDVKKILTVTQEQTREIQARLHQIQKDAIKISNREAS